MKKFLSMVLALAAILCMGTAANAEGVLADGGAHTVRSLSEEDMRLVDSIACPMGMATAVSVDADGNHVTYLGGYTFVEEEGTSLAGLMGILERWHGDGSPYEGLFFSTDWTYKAVKAEEGRQTAYADPESRTVVFGIEEQVFELEYRDILTALRTAVAGDTGNP